MAYPWIFPNVVPNNIEFVAKTLTTKFTSPFTGRSQVHRFQAGQWWELNLQFAPLTSTEARQLSGFLTGLGGMEGSFYFTVPTPMRASGSVTITVTANGNDVTVNSGSAQIGLFATDSSSKRLVQFTSATSVFPSLTTGVHTLLPATGSLYRLAANEVRFTVNEAIEYGVTIPIIESI